MRRTHLLFALLSALSAGDALADRPHGKVAEYQNSEMTEAERAAARARQRTKLGTFHEDDEDVPVDTPFPWMQVGFTILTFAVVFPFAWSAYRATAKDLDETLANNATPAKRAGKPRPSAPPPEAE